MEKEQDETALRKKLQRYETQEEELVYRQRRLLGVLEDTDAKAYHHLTQFYAPEEFIAQAIQASKEIQHELREEFQQEQKILLQKQESLKKKLKYYS